MKHALYVSIAIATSGCAAWSKHDTALEVAFAAMTIGDWAQTSGIVGICHEENPLIGACGEVTPIEIYFPVGILAHAAIAAALPPRWRTVWQAAGVGAELNQVWQNRAAGFGFDGSVPPPPPGFRYPTLEDLRAGHGGGHGR